MGLITSSAVDPSGPIFISYRWSDGARHAIDAARRLRASGVPVWLDRDDLPPGEMKGRLAEALESGLAGALLVATPQVANRKTPDAIHEVEVPRIMDDLARDPGFTVAVLNTAGTAGTVDRGAPDRWYVRDDLSHLTQYSAVDGTLELIGPAFARDRLHKLRAGHGGEPLTIDLQTRVTTIRFTHTADLIFRSVPPVAGRIPGREVWEDLQRLLSWLPRAVAEEDPPGVRLTGGAHLTVACAVGASLAEPSGVTLIVRATGGQDWQFPGQPFSLRDRLPLFGSAPRVHKLRWVKSPVVV